MIEALVTAGAGFLLAVLWFDLMFDVQVLRHRTADVPEAALASIAAYYRRVTSDARPMNRFVGLSMVVVLGGIVAELLGDDVPAGAAWASLLLVGAPIGLAATRTVPSAIRLGSRADAPERQRELAVAICRQHLFCFACIAALLVVQLAVA